MTAPAATAPAHDHFAEPQPAAAEDRSHRRPIAQLILLAATVCAVALLVYWPVLSAQAVSFDDQEVIISNPLFQNPSLESVRRFFSEVRRSSVAPGYYQPLTLTSLMLDWAMGARANDFHVFHRTSLILHLGSTVLLILLCWQLFGNPWVAALAGLLFAVHPLTVEPVVWVTERKTVLAGFFAFAALCAYVRYTRSRRPGGWFAAALLLYLLSLLSKPTATPLPLILLLIDYWPLRRLGRRAVLEKIPFLILAGLFAVLAVLCEHQVNPLSLPAATSPAHLPLRLCYLAVFYATKVVLPVRLSSVYLLPDPLVITNPIVAMAVVGTIVIIVGLFVSRRYTPAFWVGALIFYLGLAPTLGFVGYSWVLASDKYVYLPGVGLVLILAWVLLQLWSKPRRRPAVLAAAAVAAVLLGLGTRLYLRHWQTSEKLITYMARRAPQSPQVSYAMGTNLLARGEYPQAVEWLTRAIKLKPDFPYSFCNRGNCYASLGDLRMAVADFSRAIELRPGDPNIYLNRGNLHAALGESDLAAADFSEVIELRPNDVEARYSRARAYTRQGLFDEAVRDYSRIIEIHPTDAIAYHQRAAAWYYLGQIDRARTDLTECIRLGGRPNSALVKALGGSTGSSTK